MRKILPVLMLGPVLAGCGFEPLAGPVMTNLAMGGATVASYSVVGQSPVDYALSRARHQYCDIRNPKRYDGRYCVDPEPPPVDPVVYCYRTLASPDCSNQIDPHDNGNQPIVGPAGMPVQVLPVRDSYIPAPVSAVSDPMALTRADDRLQPAHPAPPPASSHDPAADLK